MCLNIIPPPLHLHVGIKQNMTAKRKHFNDCSSYRDRARLIDFGSIIFVAPDKPAAPGAIRFLHFCADVCQCVFLCFSSSAERACGSFSICWSKTNKVTHRRCYAALLLQINAKCVFFFLSIETIPALPGVASAGPFPSFCFSPKPPSRKMATSARLEVQRHIKLVGESTSEAFSRLNSPFCVCGVFAQRATTWPSRLCAQRAAWYEEYSPITDSMR